MDLLDSTSLPALLVLTGGSPATTAPAIAVRRGKRARSPEPYLMRLLRLATTLCLPAVLSACGELGTAVRAAEELSEGARAVRAGEQASEGARAVRAGEQAAEEAGAGRGAEEMAEAAHKANMEALTGLVKEVACDIAAGRLPQTREAQITYVEEKAVGMGLQIAAPELSEILSYANNFGTRPDAYSRLGCSPAEPTLTQADVDKFNAWKNNPDNIKALDEFTATLSTLANPSPSP